MYPVLGTVYGQFTLHTFGFIIVIGLLFFIYLIKKDPLYMKLNLKTSWENIFTLGIFAALLGGRIGFLLIDQGMYNTDVTVIDILSFWKGGFSILGSIIGVIGTVYLTLRYYSIPVFPFFDLHTTYAPLLQALSRIGCLFAGCCYGAPCDYCWAIVYTYDNMGTPIGIPLHPTQLYSAIALLSIFVFLYIKRTKLRISPGKTTMLYVIMVCSERFIIDFFRADRTMAAYCPFISNYFCFSGYQYLAIGIIMITVVISYLTPNTDHFSYE